LTDYLHLTKRFGIVAASQLPAHHLLAIKSPYSPLQLLFKSSHETLNIYHQLLGRIITFLLYLHGGFYLNFYIQKSLLASKLQEAYVLCGIAGILAFTAIGTTAFAPVRNWSYRAFYITHITLATALLPILFFHVSHIRLYIYETTIIYAANIIFRTLSSTTITSTLKPVPDTNLVEIIIPLNKSNSSRLWRYGPAQHGYLSLPGHPASRTVRSNPLTQSSIPPTDGQLKFHARILNGNTSSLWHRSQHSTQQYLALEGPYGVSTHADELLRYDRVLFVAGGIGGTFIVPLYRQLLADLSPSPGSYRRSKVDFLWVVRKLEDATWALPNVQSEREGFVERLRVFVTGAAEGLQRRTSKNVNSNHAEQGGIELEERKTLLTSVHESDQSGTEEKDLGGLNWAVGRPDLRNVLHLTFSHNRSERIAIMVCGPKSLSQALRTEAGNYVRSEGRDVWFWEECFGL
jgi:ferredoxin-NADP reductase